MKSTFTIEEFKPSIYFLLKFLVLYVAGNLLYGWFIHAYYPGVDPVTRWVTDHTSVLLNTMGWQTHVEALSSKPIANLVYNGRPVLAVFEGCNGLNVMIIYTAFLLAFGPYGRPLVWFIPLGLFIIHAVNLARIYLLFFVSIEKPDFMYFMHKYLFTAILYVVIFGLWMIWLNKFKKHKGE